MPDEMAVVSNSGPLLKDGWGRVFRGWVSVNRRGWIANIRHRSPFDARAGSVPHSPARQIRSHRKGLQCVDERTSLVGHPFFLEPKVLEGDVAEGQAVPGSARDTLGVIVGDRTIVTTGRYSSMNLTLLVC